jgi:predicted nucleotidyltransferase
MTAKPLLTLLQEKRPALLTLAEKYGVKNIRVFGSVARGEETPRSDIDLLVAMENGYDYLDLGGFQMDATDLLGRFVHPTLEGGVHPLIRKQVYQEAKPL